MNDVPWLRDQVSFLKKKGLNVTVFKIPNFSTLKKIKAIISLRSLMYKRNFQIVHVHWGQNSIFAFTTKSSLITTYHGSDLQGDVNENGLVTLKGLIVIFFSRLSTLLSNYNIFVSKRLINSAPKKIINNKNYIIPMGFDSDLFKPMNKQEAKQKLGLESDIKYILFAGNYSQPVKRFSLAEQVMVELDDKFELIKLNYAPHHQMSLYMNASDILLMTSYQEGAPVIIKEALACNLSVVSTDVGDVKEMIKNISWQFYFKK
jgi:Glycosyltransferase